MDSKWTRSEKLAAASIIVAVVFGIAENSGAILSVVGPSWPAFQPFAIFGVGLFVCFAILRAIAELRNRPTQEQMAEALAVKDTEIVEPSPKALLNLSPIIAQTMLELCEKETLPFGKAHNSVVKSIVNEEGYFERPTMMFSGHRRPSDIYRLTPKWRAFLADEKNMETLRRLVG